LHTQLHHLLQRGLKGLANRPAAVLQGGQTAVIRIPL
jgi:hypothetical protein